MLFLLKYKAVSTEEEFLDKYSTEEEAIEVLDMIAEAYQKCQMCRSGLRPLAKINFVFDIPKILYL